MADLVHGKASTYRHHGCRCDACRAANTAHARQYRKANPARAARASTRQSASAQLAARYVRKHHPKVWRDIQREVDASYPILTDEDRG